MAFKECGIGWIEPRFWEDPEKVIEGETSSQYSSFV
jgi:hypothetical protein